MEFSTLSNQTGMEIVVNQDDNGCGLEKIRIAGKELGTFSGGPLFRIRLSDAEDGLIPVRLPVTGRKETPESILWEFGGEREIQTVKVAFRAELRLMTALNAVTFDLFAQAGQDLEGRMEVALCQNDASMDWRANLYPWAENASHLPEELDSGASSIYSTNQPQCVSAWSERLFNWCGVPAPLFRNREKSIGFLFGVSKDCEYGKPGTWLEELSIEMAPGEPVRVVSGSRLSCLKKGVEYHLPVQMVLSAHPDYLKQPRELLEAWTTLNHYQAEPVKHPVFRDENDMMRFMLDSRREAPYYIKGAAYGCDQHRQGRFDTYIVNSPFNIYLDLLLAKITGETVWRQRAAEQVAWLKRMRVNDANDVNFGAFYPIAPGAKEPSFYLYPGSRQEFEVEQNAKAGYWLLKIAQDMKAGRLPALEECGDLTSFAFDTLRWVKKQQQADGSMPQKVALNGDVNAPTTPAHALLAFQLAFKATGEECWEKAMLGAEQWVMKHSVEPARFFGAHSDLGPNEYEEGSIHTLITYMLERYADTGTAEYVKIAEYLASVSFLWRCPKQISWTEKPTQGCNVEQSHYLQYSLYSYYSFKYLNFIRLGKLLNDPFFDREGRYLIRQSAHCIVMDGEWKGAHYERLADPWNARSDDKTPEGNIYGSELAPELLYQLLVLHDSSVAEKPAEKTV